MVDLDEIETLAGDEFPKLPPHPERVGGDHGVGMAEEKGQAAQTAQRPPPGGHGADLPANIPELVEKALLLRADKSEDMDLVGAGELAKGVEVELTAAVPDGAIGNIGGEKEYPHAVGLF
jgi:hypothetical protein